MELSERLYNQGGGGGGEGLGLEPVAVETELGWVLSGPMKSQSSGPEPVQINLVQTEDKGSLDVDVNRMWDLETIGIKEPGSGVYEEYRDSISFDGQRY